MAQELQIEIHNPNNGTTMAAALLELFFEANMDKAEELIKAALQAEDESAESTKHSA